MTGLSEAEVAGYRRGGVLVPSFRLPEGRVRALRATAPAGTTSRLTMARRSQTFTNQKT